MNNLSGNTSIDALLNGRQTDDVGNTNSDDIQIPVMTATGQHVSSANNSDLAPVFNMIFNQIKKMNEKIDRSHIQHTENAPSNLHNPPMSELTITPQAVELSQDSNLSSGTSHSVASNHAENQSISSHHSSYSTSKFMKSTLTQKSLSREISVINHFKEIEFKNLKFLTSTMVRTLGNVKESEICNTPIGRLERKFVDSHTKARELNWFEWSTLGKKALQSKRTYINREVKKSIITCK